MIVVDSGIWIDYFNGKIDQYTDYLDNLIGAHEVGVGDIILQEVLQGFRSDTDYNHAKRLFEKCRIFEMLGYERAIIAAQNYRSLRKMGLTVRKNNDVAIASFCILSRTPLLFKDRDFLPFVDHLGLIPAYRPA